MLPNTFFPKFRFENINVNLNDKPDWFWERNPLGTVPILEINDKVHVRAYVSVLTVQDVVRYSLAGIYI